MKKQHVKIDFAIAGQPKSGTTALASFLSQHPDVSISNPKEPGYFATDFMKESDAFHGKPKYFKARTKEDYGKHFAHATSSQRLGDASTCYTYSKSAAKNIYKHNPQAKIIIMLRNPVEFMHSLHMQYVNETVEDEPDFEKALALEPTRKNGKHVPPRTRCPSYHYYKTRAHYYDQIKRYYDTFPKRQILVMTNDELKKDNVAAFKKIARFLEIDDSFSPAFEEVHGSKKPRSAAVNKLAHTVWFKNALYKTLGPDLYTKTHKKVNKLLLARSDRQRLPEDLQKKLWKELEPDAKKTGKLIGQDLVGLWKKR